MDILDRFFLASGWLLFLGSLLLPWVYLDDVLLLCSDRVFLGHVTASLVLHLEALGLVVSPKTRPTPSADLVWLGKLFDLRRGSLSNSLSALAHALGVCF